MKVSERKGSAAFCYSSASRRHSTGRAIRVIEHPGELWPDTALWPGSACTASAPYQASAGPIAVDGTDLGKAGGGTVGAEAWIESDEFGPTVRQIDETQKNF